VNQKVVEAEARRQGLTVEKLLEREVDAKLGEPSEMELKAYYLGQKNRWNLPLAEIQPQLRTGLRQGRIEQARQEYLKHLREAPGVAILLRPPKVNVSSDPGRLKGSPQVPVTIVEFSDYQYPYCQAAETTLKEVLARYEGRVSLVDGDFPLSQIHAQAQLAAEPPAAQPSRDGSGNIMTRSSRTSLCFNSRASSSMRASSASTRKVLRPA
jgi:hypothetical protein